MPYCYVEDMSIVAMSRVGAKAVRAHAVRCSGRNSAVYFGHFLGWGGVFMLLPFYFIFFCFFGGFSVRCDSQQVGDTCEKSFTNNSSRFW